MSNLAGSKPTDVKHMSALAWGLILLLGFLWGGSFYFAKVAVEHIPPMTLVLLRVGIAAIALHLFLMGRHDVYQTLANRHKDFLIMGLINNVVPFTLIFLGQTVIGAGLAAILNATTPLWTVIIANFVTSDEKLSSAKLIGCGLGILGTAVLIGPDVFSSIGAPVWAQLAIVGAAISYGFAVIFGRRFGGLNPQVAATGQLTASTLVMLPIVCVLDQPWTLTWPPLDTVGSVLALALVSTAYAYILYFRIVKMAGATNASLVTLIVPPSAILFGVLLLGEVFSTLDLVGLTLIAISLLSLDGRLAIKGRRVG